MATTTQPLGFLAPERREAVDRAIAHFEQTVRRETQAVFAATLLRALEIRNQTAEAALLAQAGHDQTIHEAARAELRATLAEIVAGY